MFISSLTCGSFSLVHPGIHVENGHDTCHPFFICFSETLLGFTCPRGGSQLVLIVPHWHVMLSYPMHFTNDVVIVGTVKNCIEGFSLHLVNDDLHLDLCR